MVHKVDNAKVTFAHEDDELSASVENLKRHLQEAIYRLVDMLEGDDGQAWKEAEKSLPRLQRSLVESPEVTLERLILTKQAEAVKGLPLRGCGTIEEGIELQESATRVYLRQAGGLT